jgi:3-oxoadipate CoA-transferase beta subunit
VVMDHTTKDGRPKLVKRCGYPLTAMAAVQRVYTNLAVIDVTERGFVLRDLAPGQTLESLRAASGAEIHAPA